MVSPFPSGIFADVNFCLWPLNVTYAFCTRELAEVFDITSKWQDLHVHPLNCCRVVSPRS